MAATLTYMLICIGATLAAWLVLDAIFTRLLPRLERFAPSDVIGPDAWLADTKNHSGVFDRPLKRRGI